MYKIVFKFIQNLPKASCKEPFPLIFKIFFPSLCFAKNLFFFRFLKRPYFLNFTKNSVCVTYTKKLEDPVLSGPI